MWRALSCWRCTPIGPASTTSPDATSFPAPSCERRAAASAPSRSPPVIGDSLSLLKSLLGRGSHGDNGWCRYGVVLDTGLAANILGFEPQYKIEVSGEGASRRVDTVRYR